MARVMSKETDGPCRGATGPGSLLQRGSLEAPSRLPRGSLEAPVSLHHREAHRQTVTVSACGPAECRRQGRSLGEAGRAMAPAYRFRRSSNRSRTAERSSNPVPTRAAWTRQVGRRAEKVVSKRTRKAPGRMPDDRAQPRPGLGMGDKEGPAGRRDRRRDSSVQARAGVVELALMVRLGE